MNHNAWGMAFLGLNDGGNDGRGHAMTTVHTVRLRCPTCGQPGLVNWAHPEGGLPGPRRFIGITDGFCAVARAERPEPEILCLKCHDVPSERRLQVEAAQS